MDITWLYKSKALEEQLKNGLWNSKFESKHEFN